MPEKRVSTEQRRTAVKYCLSQSKFATESFSVEHIIPRFLGGQTELKNLALACQGCNGHKHIRIRGYDFAGGKEVNLFNPRIQKWNEHFRWNDNFTLIIGLTPAGRATVETLKLNREGLVNLRRILYAMGKHPP